MERFTRDAFEELCYQLRDLPPPEQRCGNSATPTGDTSGTSGTRTTSSGDGKLNTSSPSTTF